MIFQSNELIVRELEQKAEDLLVKWLSDPLVLKYYEGRDNPHDIHMVKKHFYRYEKNVTRCIIEFEHVEIGYIQFYLSRFNIP